MGVDGTFRVWIDSDWAGETDTQQSRSREWIGLDGSLMPPMERGLVQHRLVARRSGFKRRCQGDGAGNAFWSCTTHCMVSSPN